MPRTAFTAKSVRAAFNLANCRVPKGLITEIAFDRVQSHWNAFICNDKQYFAAAGKDPVEAVTNLCAVNNWLDNEENS